MNQIIKYVRPVLLIRLFICLMVFISCGQENSGWDQVPVILSRIVPPIFPERNFDITQFGAIGDGVTSCTEAFQKAITACHESGGGRVVIPEGTYLTGAIHLKSDVNLHVTEKAIIKFSKNPQHYLPVVFTRFEGVECINYSPFIYAYEQENIAITGKGTLDGQADSTVWWQWTGSAHNGWRKGQPQQRPDREALLRMAEEGIPVTDRIFGDGHYLRVNFIQPYKCKNILIDGITIKRSPMWEIHPVLCENVTVQNVTIISHGPNNDGCNPESSKDVLIRNCYFDTGDDCIAIKSGRNADGRRVNVASENIVIQGCTMRDGHGGVVIGSEISGNCRNVFAEDCFMDSPNLDCALRIKTNSMRGGVVENIYLRNITVGQVSEAAVKINFYYGEGDVGSFAPIVRNVEVRNMKTQKSRYALLMRGYARSPISNIRIINSEFNNVSSQNSINEVQNLILQNVSINAELMNKIINPRNDNSTSVKKCEN